MHLAPSVQSDPFMVLQRGGDASRYKREGPDTPAALAAILADLYKGEKEEFIRLNCREGFSMFNPIEWVSH